ncbi:MAG: pyruvate kinase, partial [Phycisphaerae bacterium]|nr:pyruvate kinase [Phycisphaerae bacterium]
MSTHKKAGTKIVATLGPATNTAEALGRLLAAGVDVARLNFSHGTPDDHAKAVALVRSVAASLGRPIALMGDLCGPKIRLLEVQGNAIEIPVGHRLRIVREPVLGTRDQVATNHPTIIDDAEVG